MIDLEARRAHLIAARKVLVEAVSDGEPFAPKIMAVRGGQIIAYISPGEGAGDVILRTGQLAAEGFAADEMIVLSDSYTATELANPYTMQPWRPGEMEWLAQHHQGVERGWVRDTLMMLFIRRDGSSLMHTLPYKRIGKTVEFLEPTKHEEEDENGGWTAGGPMTRMMEPLGVFVGLEHPSDELVGRFLVRAGAESVLLEKH